MNEKRKYIVEQEGLLEKIDQECLDRLRKIQSKLSFLKCASMGMQEEFGKESDEAKPLEILIDGLEDAFHEIWAVEQLVDGDFQAIFDDEDYERLGIGAGS
jgi:hypothetical protein